jgi:ribonuclease BN (tRNA processing enzyme)
MTTALRVWLVALTLGFGLTFALLASDRRPVEVRVYRTALAPTDSAAVMHALEVLEWQIEQETKARRTDVGALRKLDADFGVRVWELEREKEER